MCTLRHFSFVTIHPTFIESYAPFGMFSALQKKGLGTVQALNLRDFAIDQHGTVDARPYGGGDGMILRPEPLRDAVLHIRQQQAEARIQVVLPSPQGIPWSQELAKKHANESTHLVFICGRFGGIDQRFIDHYVDLEYSLGDFVLSGGELAALAFADSIIRHIPGILGHAESSERDSFSEYFQGGLEHPLFTKPETFEGLKVPEVLRSGHHAHINSWQKDHSIKATAQKRPDLLR